VTGNGSHGSRYDAIMIRPRHGWSRWSAFMLLATVVLAAACAPRLAPLGGAAVARPIPSPGLTAGHHQVIFTWEYEDADIRQRGEGVARLAYPDSARLDFFLAGGLASGAAILIGDSLQLPGPELFHRLVPPAPMLWASVGRAAVPALPDTAVAIDGDLLRADIGRPVAFRITFRGDSMARVDRVTSGRVVEWLVREADGLLRYRHEGARRSLSMRITRTERVPAFDASIWRLAQ
jgi:hypothetical protein